jgi:hypothetical protein
VGPAPAGAREPALAPGGAHDPRRRVERTLNGLGLSIRGVAETLFEQTRYANAHSAEVALLFQFKRRGWPLRGRAQAQGRAAR